MNMMMMMMNMMMITRAHDAHGFMNNTNTISIYTNILLK